jgi:hypothetical protein
MMVKGEPERKRSCQNIDVIVVLSGWTKEKHYNELLIAEILTRDLQNTNTALSYLGHMD